MSEQENEFYVNECFDCLNHGEGKVEQGVGWSHDCKLGIENKGLKNIENCPKWKPNWGFQIGGYYSHTHFEQDGNCLELTFHSDGEFPEDDPSEMIKFHICNFTQIETWVAKWGKYLREKGML